MLWDKEKLDAAVIALKASSTMEEASIMLGVTPASIKDAFRRAGLEPPSSFLAPVKTVSKKTYVIVSDVHVPSHSVPAVQAVGALMRDIKPDGLIVNGDFLDLIELSKHATASVAQLEGLRITKVFEEGNKLLDYWQTCAGPQCKDNRFIDGNHEDRLRRWIEKGDNAVWLGDEGVSIEGRLHFEDRGFMYCKGYPKAYTKLGHLVVTHGRWCGKYAAAIHLDRYRHSVMVGHVHTPGTFYGPGLEKQQVGIVTGHLADITKPALGYASVPNSWQLGFAVVHVEANKSFHLCPLNFVDGAFYYGGKRYGR